MNKTKKYLIIVAIIFNFVTVAWDIYDIVAYFLLEPQNRPAVFYLIFSFIEIFASIAVAVLLIMAIWKNGVLFRQRYGYYMTALVISIIISLFSVSTILLIITMFISDWVWERPEKEDKVFVSPEENKEEKIAKLRQRYANGEISSSEFEEELMKLL